MLSQLIPCEHHRQCNVYKLWKAFTLLRMLQLPSGMLLLSCESPSTTAPPWPLILLFILSLPCLLPFLALLLPLCSRWAWRRISKADGVRHSQSPYRCQRRANVLFFPFSLQSMEVTYSHLLISLERRWRKMILWLKCPTSSTYLFQRNWCQGKGGGHSK